MNEEILKNQKDKLVRLLNNTDNTNKLKKNIHYYSLLNITDILIDKENKKRPEELIKQIYEYYCLIFDRDLIFDKFEVIENYTKYIYPSGKYMIYNYKFISTHNLYNSIVFGVVLDLILVGWNNLRILGYPIPIFTLLLLAYGIYKRYRAKKQNRYFAGNY